MSASVFSRSMLVLLCGLTAAYAPGLAQAQEYGAIRWRSDYNLARREAAERKLPILIDFYKVPCAPCQRLDAEFFQDPTVAKMINERFIPLRIDGMHPNNQELVQRLNIEAFPTLVLATFDGKIPVQPIVGFQGRDILYDYLVRVLGSISEPDWIVQNHKQALKFWQAKDYVRAIPLLRAIVDDNHNGATKAAAQKMLQNLEEVGQARLAMARDLLKSQRLNEAIEIANETQRSFPGLQVSLDAGGFLRDVMQSDEIRVQERSRKARELLAQAQAAYKLRDFFVCIDRCETLVKKYGDMAEGQEAYLISANIKSDPQFLAGAGEALEERLGDVWIASGEYYLRANQRDQARYYYERVLRSFPNTRQSSFAQIRLGQIANANSLGVPTMMPQMPGH